MKIIHARGLKCNVPNTKLNTRVQILLITPLKTRNIPRKTKVVENSNDPIFEQLLEIKLTRKTTRSSTVEVSIWSIDDFYKESLIGGFAIDLKKFDVAQRNIIEEEIQTEFEVSLVLRFRPKFCYIDDNIKLIYKMCVILEIANSTYWKFDKWPFNYVTGTT